MLPNLNAFLLTILATSIFLSNNGTLSEKPTLFELTNNGHDFFEGDIKRLFDNSPKEMNLLTRNAKKDIQSRWPNKMVLYYFDKVSIGFHPIQGGQSLSLGKRCWRPDVIRHELMHTLGFYHEHSRYDRDHHVNIFYENIKPAYWSEYAIRLPSEAELLTPYDYNSIMHYESNAWAINAKQPTMTAKVEGVQIGHKKTFSSTDFTKINLLYNCTDFLHFADHADQEISAPDESAINPWTLRPHFALSAWKIDCKKEQHCNDEDPINCPIMAFNGWCEKLPGKLMLHCRRSCCNCFEERCMDTSDGYYWNMHCLAFNFIKRSKISNMQDCHSETTSTLRKLYCPKTCGLC
ncbi:Zinc metalloproteinase nas-15 [Trichinella pseudospiralis]|uniref:Metalloendopeptidase n=1 Tax=Trichinella pseudospiralis TaxID=6337 RepID=A0A0V1E7R7_TRIPS|nr:Zinc metalloproteinase nas-15 [Trichinella pseudospiralis]